MEYGEECNMNNEENSFFRFQNLDSSSIGTRINLYGSFNRNNWRNAQERMF